MAASLTSPDGDETLEVVEVDGRSYDLPPWLNEAEFREGLASGDDENPLSSLVSCKLDCWSRGADYDPEWSKEVPPWSPVFAVEWFVPYGALRELVVNVFTPEVPEGGWRSQLFQVEFTELGAIIRGQVTEYRDFNDVQAMLIPGDVREFEYAADRDESWLAELLDEYKYDPAEFEREAAGWDGLVVEHEAGGVQYKLVLKVHED